MVDIGLNFRNALAFLKEAGRLFLHAACLQTALNITSCAGKCDEACEVDCCESSIGLSFDSEVASAWEIKPCEVQVETGLPCDHLERQHA